VRALVSVPSARSAWLNTKDADGFTPLALAIHLDKTDAATELLCQPDVDVNAALREGATPLHLAVERGHGALCEALLAHGANPLARAQVVTTSGSPPPRWGATAGELAVSRGALPADTVRSLFTISRSGAAASQPTLAPRRIKALATALLAEVDAMAARRQCNPNTTLLQELVRDVVGDDASAADIHAVILEAERCSDVIAGCSGSQAAGDPCLGHLGRWHDVCRAP
jgi:hypothetical protein